MGACKKYMNLEKLKEYAINAATNAGKFLNSNKLQKKEIISEEGRDIKLEIDRSTELLIRRDLSATNINILGEEF